MFKGMLLVLAGGLLAACQPAGQDAVDTAALKDQSSTQAQLLYCGRLPIRIEYRDDLLLLEERGLQRQLLPVISASGARFEAEGDPSTSFWSKGQQGQLELAGEAFPACLPAGAVAEPFVASGNEPFWSIELAGGELTLSRLDDAQPRSMPYRFEPGENGLLRVLTDADVTLEMREQVCHDSMTGMPRPQEVTLLLDGQRLHGCGGDPERLLQGVLWQVVAIDGEPPLPASRANMRFFADGRLAGRASCNNFIGRYTLSAEGLGISSPATTMRGCELPVMAQERRLLELLEGVQSLGFDGQDDLLLQGSAGTLRARPFSAAAAED